MKLDKTEILLIRACCSNDPLTRLKSVYRHQYLNCVSDGEREIYIASILLRLIKKLDLQVDITRLLNDIAPSRRMFEIHAGDENDSHWLTVIKWVISKIRYDVDKKELIEKNGFISPLRHRTKIEEAQNALV